MTDSTDSPVIFQSRAGGREVALLGMIEVGAFVMVAPGAFFWRLFLPFCSQMGRTNSQDSARDQLRDKIEQWVEAAGLAPTRKDEMIRVFRADDERDWRSIKAAVRT